MIKDIDCLLIGHNEMDFEKYEMITKRMGLNSGAYRDLNLSYIRFNNKPYTAAGIFNLITGEDERFKPVKFGETFSAAIAYLGSFLNRNGCTFDYINSFQDEKARLAEILKQDNVITIAILTTLYVFALPIIEIIDFIKKYNQRAKIIVGGPFISNQVGTQKPSELEYLFKEAIKADFFVNSSQGESTLVKIIRALKNNLPVKYIENIYYKTGNKVLSTALLKENNRLTENPVNWNLFPGNIGEYVNFRTAISCPFSCSFCGFPQRAGSYQTLSVESIEHEMNVLDSIGCVRDVNIIDDTLNFPIKRFREILRMMIRNKYKFRWHSYFRCQYADREMAELMKMSGCDGVFLGIESGNPQILKNMNKACDPKEYLDGIALLKEYGIVTFGSFIIGFPGETADTFRDTVKFIKESGLDFYRTQLWYCDPITPIWDQREQYDIKGESFEWSHSTMDSKTACDLIDESIAIIEDPIWIPQYNFDFDSIWHLIHQGMSMEEVKNFLKAFCKGIREKLSFPLRKEASDEVIEQLIRVSRGNCGFGAPGSLNGESKILEKYNAEFDY